MQRFEEEAFGGCSVSRGTEEKFQSMAFRVDGSVEISPGFFDFDVGFIDAPGVSGGFEVRSRALVELERNSSVLPSESTAR